MTSPASADGLDTSQGRRGRLRRRAVAALLATGLVLAGGWWARERLLAAAGRALVREDADRQAELTFVAFAGGRGAVLEAARLWHEGRTAWVVVASWPSPPVDGAIRALGIPLLEPTELTRRILDRAGVPADRVEILPAEVAGTIDEAKLLAEHVRLRRVSSVRYLTARSHTSRARWLLLRSLPREVKLIAGSSREDRFSADAWWTDRASAREVAMEYLRWLNVLVLRDPWPAHAPPRPDGSLAALVGVGTSTPAPCSCAGHSSQSGIAGR